MIFMILFIESRSYLFRFYLFLNISCLTIITTVVSDTRKKGPANDPKSLVLFSDVNEVG